MVMTSDDPVGFLVFGLAVLAVISVGTFWGAFRIVRVTRLIENLPTSKIRSAPQGYVELVGVVQWVPGQRITSPLSGTECVWWSYEIKQRKRDPRGHVAWRTVEQGTSREAFLLKDDTGQCVINPLGAELIGAELKSGGERREWYGTTPRPESGLADKGTSVAPATDPAYKYQERVIRRDTPTHVLGDFRTRQVAASDVAAAGELHTVSKPRQGDQPFILSTRMQRELSDGSRGVAWFLFACFLASGALLAWALEGLWQGKPARQIVFGLLSAFALVLFIVLSVGPFATGVRVLFGAPAPSSGEAPARRSRWTAIPILAFSLLMGALTGFLCYWAGQEATASAANSKLEAGRE